MNILKYLKNDWLYYVLALALVIIIVVILILDHYFGNKELFGAFDNLAGMEPEYASDLTYQDRERESVEAPGQFETASDMPEATVGDVSPNLYML